MRLSALLAVLCVLPLVAAPPGGIFVAVGKGGRRISSPDGVRWENDTRWPAGAAAADEALHDAAFGLGRFVAVGGGAAKGRIVATRDGKTWRELPAPPGCVTTIVFGGGRFIASHGGELLWSADGEKFVAGAKLDWPGTVRAFRAAWGDGEGGHRCVIVGDLDPGGGQPREGWRASTPDGIRYTSRDRGTRPARDVAYGAGLWVVVGPGGLIESSIDGQTWQPRTAGPDEDFQRVVWTGSRFLATEGKVAWSSPDGVNWAKAPEPIPGRLAWAREEALGIAFSPGGDIHLSTDLAAWRKLPVPPGAPLKAVVFGTP